MEVFVGYTSLCVCIDALKHEKKPHVVFDVGHDDVFVHDKEEDVIHEFLNALEEENDVFSHETCMFHDNLMHEGKENVQPHVVEKKSKSFQHKRPITEDGGPVSTISGKNQVLVPEVSKIQNFVQLQKDQHLYDHSTCDQNQNNQISTQHDMATIIVQEL